MRVTHPESVNYIANCGLLERVEVRRGFEVPGGSENLGLGLVGLLLQLLSSATLYFIAVRSTGGTDDDSIRSRRS